MRIFRICLLGVSLLATAPAFAQSDVAAAIAQTNPPAANAADRVERHIGELKRRLAITSAETPQWEAFAAVMRDNGHRMTQLYQDRSTRPSAMKATDDMHQYADMTRAHADDMQRLVPAFDALYSTMPLDQQAKADKIFQSFQARKR